MTGRYFADVRTIDSVLAFHAAGSPERAAVVTAASEISYAELDRRSNQVARALVADGVVPGTRVAFIGWEDLSYYEVLFGVARAGAVLVPINWRLSAPEVAHILQDSGATTLFADQAAESLSHIVGRTRVLRLDTGEYARWRDAQPAQPVSAGTGDEDPVAQLYTSGTTGLPKGVVLPQRSFFAIADLMARAGVDWIDWRAGDISLVGLPGFHIGGLWWVLQGFRAGVTKAVMPHFTADNALALFERYPVTNACMAPAMIQLLLSDPRVSPRTFTALRKVVYGGSPISESLLERALRMFRCDFAQIYGLTETGNTAVCLPPDQHRPGSPRLQAAGRPYPGVECRVVGSDGETLGAGQVGEVHLRTPARMLEYWNLPEATAETLVDGWIVTGDAGYLDEEGYLFIHDRVKDMIISAGENIYPAEVENVLAAHPAVADVAVIGVPDDRWGEAVHAYVALNDGHVLDRRDLVEFATQRLASFKLPTGYHEIDTIPRNPSGKILRRELRQSHWTDRQRQVN